MLAAGCDALEFGTDSGSPAMLRNLGKSFSVETVREASRLCREFGVDFAHYILFGGPGESEETIGESFTLMDELAPTAVIAMTGIRIFPGTRLADIARAEGLLAPAWDPLEPVFYLAPQVRPILEERLRAFAEDHRNWVFPGLGVDRFPGETLKMHQMGFTGPLWTYLRPRKRKRGGTTS